MFLKLHHAREAGPPPLRHFLWLSCSLALALPLSLSSAIGNPLPDKPHIYVEGYAEFEVTPDLMVVTVGLGETHDELESAKNVVDERSQTLIQLAREIGIDRLDIATTSLGIRPAYDYVDDRRIDSGTIVYRQVTLTLRDLSLYPQLMQALVEAEISSTIDTRLRVADEDALTDQALTEALSNARQRAEELATSQGKRLGTAYSISEFAARRNEGYSLYPTRRIEGQSSTTVGDVAAFAAPVREPFEPGLMKAMATVYVVFLLK